MADLAVGAGLLAAEHERIPYDVSQGDSPGAGERVVLRADQLEGILGDGPNVELLWRFVAVGDPNDADVGITGSDQLPGELRGAIDEREVHCGKSLPIGGDGLAQGSVKHRCGCHDGEGSRNGAVAVGEYLAKGIEAFNEWRGHFYEAFAILCQRKLRPADDDKCYAVFVLKRTDLLPNRRHRETERCGSRGKTALTRQLHKGSDLAEADFFEVAPGGGSGCGLFLSH